MQRSRYAFFCALLICAVQAQGQFKKQFFVEDSKEFTTVVVNLRFNTGMCLLKSSQEPGVFNIYSKSDISDYDHSYQKEIKGKVCHLDLELEDSRGQGLSKSISSSFFGSSASPEQNTWKVFLSQNKVYSLNLEYGVGNANIDLSELALNKLRIHSGSADVNVGYFSEYYNRVNMDTFFVKVDLGNVKVRNLTHANSAFVRADVGFGTLHLDLADTPTRSSTIKGNVGAGTLFIALPPNSVPIKVKVNDSWLCSLNIPAHFTKIAQNTYVNDSYKSSQVNALEFDLDVAMGSLVFQQD